MKNSIIDFPQNYTVIDTETTGLSPDYCELIELAAIKVRNNSIVDTIDLLIKPSKPIDDFIIALTGITNEMVNKCPHVDEVMPKYIEFIGNDVIVGHNVRFDINFINVYSDKQLSNNYIDTLRLSRKLLPELKHHRLTDISQKLSINAKTYHRALADCETTKSILDAFHNIALTKYENINEFFDIFKYKSYFNKIDIGTLHPETNEFDKENPLYNKECVFTGVLKKLERKDAMQIVLNCGGTVGNHVTKKTNYLILGNNDFCKSIKDGKSSKQKKVEELKLKGFDIEVVPETMFYQIIGK